MSRTSSLNTGRQRPKCRCFAGIFCLLDPTSCCPFAARKGAERAYSGNERSFLQGNQSDGSDGTRTRDLRRDRPLRGSRQWPTIDAQSLYPCGVSRPSRWDSAWISEAVFRRLLPVCCPGWAARVLQNNRSAAGPPPAHQLVRPLVTIPSSPRRCAPSVRTLPRRSDRLGEPLNKVERRLGDF